jgi:hypothetical protein
MPAPASSIVGVGDIVRGKHVVDELLRRVLPAEM